MNEEYVMMMVVVVMMMMTVYTPKLTEEQNAEIYVRSRRRKTS
jgi:hypothetical protein